MYFGMASGQASITSSRGRTGRGENNRQYRHEVRPAQVFGVFLLEARDANSDVQSFRKRMLFEAVERCKGNDSLPNPPWQAERLP